MGKGNVGLIKLEQPERDSLRQILTRVDGGILKKESGLTTRELNNVAQFGTVVPRNHQTVMDVIAQFAVAQPG